MRPHGATALKRRRRAPRRTMMDAGATLVIALDAARPGRGRGLQGWSFGSLPTWRSQFVGGEHEVRPYGQAAGEAPSALGRGHWRRGDPCDRPRGLHR